KNTTLLVAAAPTMEDLETCSKACSFKLAVGARFITSTDLSSSYTFYHTSYLKHSLINHGRDKSGPYGGEGASEMWTYGGEGADETRTYGGEGASEMRTYGGEGADETWLWLCSSTCKLLYSFIPEQQAIRGAECR